MAVVLSDKKILDGGGKQIKGENGERRQGLTTVAVVLSKKKNFDDEGKQVRGEKKGESRQSLTTIAVVPATRETPRKGGLGMGCVCGLSWALAQSYMAGTQNLGVRRGVVAGIYKPLDG